MSVAGILLITRHGDRMGFYQSPTTYSAVQTNLTVLGYSQEYANGQDIRNVYLNATSPLAIQGINVTQAESVQSRVMADAGGEGTVIVDSSNALLQGLYPPFDDAITLANGTQVVWSRAQSVYVETIESDQQVWLEGWTGCGAWTDRLNAWYNSDEFKSQAAIANPFFESLQSVLGEARPATLQNAWNLFDYLNVESIHNSTVANQLSDEQLSQARYWANYHEAGSFVDSDPNNVGNIAGQAFLAPMLSSIHDIANTTNPLKFAYMSASYKPFLSLFSMMQLPAPLSNTVVDYASAAIVEVSTDNTVRLLFRNGTSGDFEPYNMFGNTQASMSVTDFMNKLQPYAINDLAEWCDVCQTTDARGCSVLASYNGTGGAGYADATSTLGRHHVSPVVAGVIGAMVTLAVVAAGLATWLLLGGLKKRVQSSSSQTGPTGQTASVSGDTQVASERKNSNLS
jgi:hypothetical protein